MSIEPAPSSTPAAPARRASLPADIVADAAPPGLILYGRDERGRPHASCFIGPDADAAERAAELMNLRTLPLHEPAHRELAALLPAGRIFPASGKAFVPFVKAELFERLAQAGASLGSAMPIAAAGKAAGGAPADGGDDTGGSPPGGAGGGDKRPLSFDGIGRGSLVLACAGPMEGWFEAVVEYTKADDSFTLRWRDWPLEPTIVRKRSELGLLATDERVGIS